jgi:hypothetical protein
VIRGGRSLKSIWFSVRWKVQSNNNIHNNNIVITVRSQVKTNSILFRHISPVWIIGSSNIKTTKGRSLQSTHMGRIFSQQSIILETILR